MTEGKKKILVAEDTKNIRDIIVFMLKNRGYEIIEAVNGLQAEQKAKAEKPDLIVLDVMMPDKTGFEVCSELKDNPEYKDIKVIMVTAVAKGTGKEDEYWKEKSRADDFISKPFRAQDLVARIEKLLAAKAG